ncbi:Serine/threonine-protein kinase AFC2 [Acorus gramineus]|uniref:Serine/threonine-protein kinase AFC2 n=1 Tax=Acorus gramineus TaxID=55184 RepID=A0AAV9A113_ACOGR|nr:Serine/threonine-protein kinase AFC2 [Acorus gramineus]
MNANPNSTFQTPTISRVLIRAFVSLFRSFVFIFSFFAGAFMKMDRSRESPHAQSELRASKRPRLAGDVHGSPKSGVGCEQEVDGDHLNRDETETCSSLNAKGTARNGSPPWRDDDKDRHYVFALGENLTSRYKIHSKMGKGTFGQVLECWDRKRKEMVSPRSSSAIKLIDFGSTIYGHKDQYYFACTSQHAQKYVREGRLNWPEGATSKDSVKAVQELPRLPDPVMRHADHSAGDLIELLQGLLQQNPVYRLSAREALRHPFFMRDHPR